MSTQEKSFIEEQYGSYEEIAKAFSSSGTECTKIYLFTLGGEEEPTHYKMIRGPEELDAMFDSPNVKLPKLTWSKDKGPLIPYKSSGK